MQDAQGQLAKTNGLIRAQRMKTVADGENLYYSFGYCDWFQIMLVTHY
jgi:hypothetical protein